MIYSQTDIISYVNDQFILTNLKWLKPSDHILSFNLQTKEIELDRITMIEKCHTNSKLVNLNMGNINNFIISNDTHLLTFNSKFILSNSYNGGVLKTIKQLDNLNFENKFLKTLDKLELTKELGFLVGYWLGCNRGIERYLTFDLPIEHQVEKYINNLCLSSIKKDDSLVIIDDYFKHWIMDQFISDKIKHFSNWTISANIEFINGLLYGIINTSSNIQITPDKKIAVCYLTTSSKKLAYDIVKLLNVRFNTSSYVITEKEGTVFTFKVAVKITKQFMDLLNNGIVEGYYDFDDFDKVWKYILNVNKNIKKISSGVEFNILNFIRKDQYNTEVEMIKISTANNNPIILTNGLIIQ
jgi:hypothetical protein